MLSEALRLIRVFHDLKQFELAEKLGVSKSHVSEVENGNRTPSIDLINKYAEAFSIPASSILFFAENMSDASKVNDTRMFVAGKVLDILRFIEKKSSQDAA